MKSLAGWVSVNCTVESSTAVTPLTSLPSMYARIGSISGATSAKPSQNSRSPAMVLR